MTNKAAREVVAWVPSMVSSAAVAVSPLVSGARSAAFHPSIALAAYAETLLSGARVAYFGDATLPLVEEMAARGTRVAHVYDPDPERTADAATRLRRRSLYFAPLTDFDDLGVRDGAFDVALVPDLSIFGSEAGPLLALVRRALGPQGVALVASPNAKAKTPVLGAGRGAEPLDYYELYEAISTHFRSVRMLGQAAFVACTVAELSAEGEPDPTIDTSLTPTEAREPEWFVVLAGERPTRLEPFVLVELPPEALPALEQASADDHSFAPEQDAREEESGAPERADERAAALEAAEAARAIEAEAARAIEKAAVEARAMAEQRIAALTSERDGARERAREAERRAEELEHERAAASERIAELERERAASAAAREKLIQGHEKELARIEERLRERGHELARAKTELKSRERVARELLANLEQVASAGTGGAWNGDHTDGNLSTVSAGAAAPAGSVPDTGPAPSVGAAGVAGFAGSAGSAELEALRARMDELAAQTAQREADLVAATWQIAHLERQLSRGAR